MQSRSSLNLAPDRKDRLAQAIELKNGTVETYCREDGPHPSIDDAAQLCIQLHLKPWQSRILFEKAGLKEHTAPNLDPNQRWAMVWKAMAALCAELKAPDGEKELKALENDIRRKQYESRKAVQGFYQTLWEHYAEAQNPREILLCAQQILYHYFMQTCHVDEKEFIRALLDPNGENPAAGKDIAEEQRNKSILYCMLTLMGESSSGFADGMNFDMRAVQASQIRRLFEKIFIVMHQEQHYQHMCRTAPAHFCTVS